MEELPHLEPGPNPTRKELLRESRCKGNRILCCREEPIPHRGNSCTAGTCSCESRVLCDRDYSYGGRHSTQKPWTTPKRAKSLQRYQRYQRRPMAVWWPFGGGQGALPLFSLPSHRPLLLCRQIHLTHHFSHAFYTS